MSWLGRKPERVVPRVEVLTLRPGDRLVVETPEQISRAVASEIRQSMAEFAGIAPERVLVVVNATVRVLREGSPPPPLVRLEPATERRGI